MDKRTILSVGVDVLCGPINWLAGYQQIKNNESFSESANEKVLYPYIQEEMSL